MSAQKIFGNLTRWWKHSSASFPPSRSCSEAGVMTSAHNRPSVSTTICRLRPTTFFSRGVAFRPALLGSFDRLAVEDRGARPRLVSGPLAHPLPQRIVNLLPGAVLLPMPEVMKHDPIRRQIVRKRTPRTTAAGLIEHRVDDFAALVARRTPTRLGLRHPRLDAPPLLVREIGRI